MACVIIQNFKLKKIIFCFSVLLLTLNLSIGVAQDSVYFRNSNVETGKVSQIGQGRVLFMPDTFAKDRVIVQYRASKIHRIKYQSGRVDTVWGNPLYQNTANFFGNYKLPHHHELDISMYKIWKKNIFLQYTYYFQKRNFSITIPVNFIKDKFNFGNSNGLIQPRFSTGFIVRTYSNSQSKYGFYAGLGVLTGNSKLYNYDSRYGTEYIGEKYFINPIINFGYQHYLNSLFYLSINSSFGPIFFPYYRKFDQSQFTLEARLGFKIN